VNRGFEKAVELFERNISTLASMAETVATAVGAPFLRVDFFVGDPKWGVRLNEVAYGCGIDYRNLMEGTNRMVDDAPAIARILQEGHNLCRKKKPDYFLKNLGAQGRSYNELVVDEFPEYQKQRVDPRAAAAAVASKDQCEDCRVKDELCSTTHGVGAFINAGRSISFPTGQGPANLLSQHRALSFSQPPPRSVSFNWAPLPPHMPAPRSLSMNGGRFA
jgi:hypothetical protein